MVRRHTGTATHVAVLAMSILIVGAVALAGGILLDRSHFAQPVSFQNGASPTSAPVSSRSFSDPQSVKVAFTRSPKRVLHSPMMGLVTETDCTTQEPVISGQKVLSLDGQVVMALHTTMPMWRVPVIGTEGQDISSLQNALVELGQNISVTGKYSRETDRAFRAVLSSAGMTITAYQSLPLDHVLWIPDNSVSVSECLFSVGDVLQAGQDLIELTRDLSQVAIQNLPTDIVSGSRNLTAGSWAFQTSEDGIVADPTELANIQATPQYQEGIEASTDEPVIVDMQWELQNPLSVSSVPPRSLFDIATNQGCVASNGKVYRVAIVASSLGSALVQFAEDDQIPSTVDLDPVGLTCG